MFPKQAGEDVDENDKILRAELKAAGIPIAQEDAGEDESWAKNIFIANSKRSLEVITSVTGTLHDWQFTRAWRYWICKGPGIPLKYAEILHNNYGQTVRVDGNCTCPSPGEKYKGFACGYYHVDDAVGLKALADCIKAIVNDYNLSLVSSTD
jgi:hypothetical protein